MNTTSHPDPTVDLPDAGNNSNHAATTSVDSQPFTVPPDAQQYFHKHDFQWFVPLGQANLNDALIISIDSEYVSGALEKGAKNSILSFQAVTLNPVTGQTWGFCADCEGRRRMTLTELLQAIVADSEAAGIVPAILNRIMLCAHFSVAELTALADFGALRTSFDGIRRTYASVKEPLPVGLRMHGTEVEVKVHLLDTGLLAPTGARSLDALGAVVGLEKIKLDDGVIAHMDELKKNDPDQFWRYACRDVDVAIAYLIKILALSFEIFGTWHIPVTLGGMAPKVLLKIWNDLGINSHAALGSIKQQYTKWLPNGDVRTRWRFVDHPRKLQLVETAAAAYCGGRNEAFVFGPSEVGKITDFDLCGAYTTGMSTMGMPIWDKLRTVRHIDELTLDVIGCAFVDFQFPSGTRFPCIPVREANSLIFPLAGKAWATAPEIVVAKALGAELNICAEGSATDGLILPMDFDARPMAPVTKFIDQQRKLNKATKPLLEKLFKEVGNSIYGKLAQAVRPRKLLNTRSGELEELGPSRITNAYWAMHITGLIRACLAEILNRLPLYKTVISVTTDGFLTTATLQEVEDACSGPLCTMFSRARSLIEAGPEIVEVKHIADQVLCFKTRGQATLAPNSEPEAPEHLRKLLLAKGGINTKAKEWNRQNDEIVNMFFHREAGKKTEVNLLRGFSAIYKGHGTVDLNQVSKQIEYNMDFDWKRRPATYGERTIDSLSTTHLWFDTVPLESVDEFRSLRARAKCFGQAGRTLKTVKDLKDLLDSAAVVSPRVHRSSKGGSPVETVKKAFLRAYTQSAWGVRRTLTNKELAATLSQLGYKTRVDEVENAKRPTSQLLEHAVKPTEEVRAFVKVVGEAFPGFPWDRVLAP